MTCFERKICSRSELSLRMAQLARPLVLTNGVFDILHRGHVTYLAEARALGAALVVAVNSDDSVRRLGKGSHRPLNSCSDRMALLAALESTNLITSFEEDTAQCIVEVVRPELYVKGGDYVVDALPESRALATWGGTAIAIPFRHFVSTTTLVEKIRQH